MGSSWNQLHLLTFFLKASAQAQNYTENPKETDLGSYRPAEDQSGGDAASCIPPLAQHGTKVYYIVPNVDTSLLAGACCPDAPAPISEVPLSFPKSNTGTKASPKSMGTVELDGLLEDGLV